MGVEIYGLYAWVARKELGGPVCISGEDDSEESLSVNLYTSADNDLIGVQVTQGPNTLTEIGLVPPDTFGFDEDDFQF